MYLEKNSIVYPNVHEYMRRGMDESFPQELLIEWKSIAAGYSEIASLWEGEKKVILSPQKVNSEFLSYHETYSGFNKLESIVPNKFTSETSFDFLQDNYVMKKIVCFAENSQDCYFIPWGATKGAYSIVEKIKDLAYVKSIELPKECNYWTSSYYDTKLGFKELCWCLNLPTPSAYLCDDILEAKDIIKILYRQKKSCVLKANKGAGGFGNLFISNDDFKLSFEELENRIDNQIKEMPYFNTGAMLIEELVEKRKSYKFSSGFANGFIYPDGTNCFVAAGSDYHDDNHYYSGAWLGKNIISKDILSQLKETVDTIGNKLSKNGYRGHWGFNFLIDKNGKMVLLELNPRRCGESHIHSLANKFYGDNWMETITVLNHLPLDVIVERYIEPGEVLRQFEIANLLEKGAIAIPVQISWLEKKRFKGIGYIVMGEDISCVKTMDHKVKMLLSKIGIHAK